MEEPCKQPCSEVEQVKVSVSVFFSGCHIWDWGGAFCILDGLTGIVDSEFDNLEDILLLGLPSW